MASSGENGMLDFVLFFVFFTAVGNNIIAYLYQPSLGDSRDLIWGLLQLFIETRRKLFVLFRWSAACWCHEFWLGQRTTRLSCPGSFGMSSYLDHSRIRIILFLFNMRKHNKDLFFSRNWLQFWHHNVTFYNKRNQNQIHVAHLQGLRVGVGSSADDHGSVWSEALPPWKEWNMATNARYGETWKSRIKNK